MNYCHVYGSKKISKGILPIVVTELKKLINFAADNEEITINYRVLRKASPSLIKYLKNKDSLDYIIKMSNKIKFYKKYFI